ncbi:MAG: PIN domain-containing protein [Terracidiphilus sp.]|jgi:predicted nucleic acid-binding protein
MNRVYWDSMMFIYLLEANPVFGPRAQLMHDAMLRRGDRLCTGVFTVAEVLTGPRKRNDTAGINALKKFFSGSEVEILPFNMETADRYSIIRAQERVSQADGIHLATAAATGVDLFVTNDGELQKLVVPGIRFFADVDGKVV